MPNQSLYKGNVKKLLDLESKVLYHTLQQRSSRKDSYRLNNVSVTISEMYCPECVESDMHQFTYSSVSLATTIRKVGARGEWGQFGPQPFVGLTRVYKLEKWCSTDIWKLEDICSPCLIVSHMSNRSPEQHMDIRGLQRVMVTHDFVACLET